MVAVIVAAVVVMVTVTFDVAVMTTTEAVLVVTPIADSGFVFEL